MYVHTIHDYNTTEILYSDSLIKLRFLITVLNLHYILVLLYLNLRFENCENKYVII